MKPELNLIVCVAKNNLIGDKNPKGNGMLWHSKEELLYYKSITSGNIVVFGGKTAQFVPLDLIKKTRIVEILHRGMDVDQILQKYKSFGKNIFICGGASIYKYFLENYNLDKLYISRLKDHVQVKESASPLFLPNVEQYGYTKVSSKEFNDFYGEIYEKKK